MSEDQAEKGTRKVWVSKYETYDLLVSPGGRDADGRAQPGVVATFGSRQRHKLVLDISSEKDLDVHNALLSSPQCGVDFHLVERVDRRQDSVGTRAETMGFVTKMTDRQLFAILDEDVLRKLPSGDALTHDALALAVVENYKLTNKETGK